MTVVLVTHAMGLAHRADRVVHLKSGRIAAGEGELSAPQPAAREAAK